MRDNVPYSEGLAEMIYLDHPDTSGGLNRALSDFLSSMLQMDPRDRVSAKELLRHRWLENRADDGGLVRILGESD